METEQFDEFTRQLSDAGSSRRRALRALGGVLFVGALGGVAARLGPVEAAEAKLKGKDRKRGAESKRQGQFQAEGRRKGKKKHKKREREEECGLTAPLCGNCGQPICIQGDWICAYNGEKDCGGGVCVAEDACCPGQKKCPGYTECFAADDCCPAVNPPPCAECEKLVCESGELVCQPKDNCCSTGKKQCGGECIPEAECCGTIAPLCQDNEQAVCCQGTWVCRYHRDLPAICEVHLPERTYNPANCRCECPPDSNEGLNLCCPLGYYASISSDAYCCPDTGRFEDCVCALGFNRDHRNVCVRST